MDAFGNAKSLRARFQLVAPSDLIGTGYDQIGVFVEARNLDKGFDQQIAPLFGVNAAQEKKIGPLSKPRDKSMELSTLPIRLTLYIRGSIAHNFFSKFIWPK